MSPLASSSNSNLNQKHNVQRHLEHNFFFLALFISKLGRVPKEIITYHLVLPYEQLLSADRQQVCLHVPQSPVMWTMWDV